MNNNEFKGRFSHGASGLKFPREQGFFDKSATLRMCVVFLFSLVIFAVLHFRETHVDVFEVNRAAEKYVVSQVDFDFFDDESTLIRQQEASRDIGKIYRFDEQDVRQKRVEFEKYLVYDQSWRKKAEQSTFEEMYRGVDDIEKHLLALRFTDPRTIQKMKQLGIANDNYLVYVSYDLAEAISIPKRIWKHAEQFAFAREAYQPGTIDYIITYFRGKSWRLSEDNDSLRSLYRAVNARIPEQYTHVHAGDRILVQGEMVTPRHLSMLHAMKRALADNRNLWCATTILGSLIMTVLLVTVGGLYLHKRFPDIVQSNRKLLLMFFVIMMTLAFARSAEHLLVVANTNFFEVIRYPLFVPFAAMIICTLMNMELAFIVSGFLVIVLSMTLAMSKDFMTINLIAAVIAVLGSTSFRSRKKIFVVCIRAWVGCVAFIVALNLYKGTFATAAVTSDIFTTLGFMLLTSVIVIGILPFIEFLFPIMTDAIIMEYLDPNNELLSRLAMEAPGTYQHSIVVGNLAESAAQAIGANGLFCRGASLYHDIGKLRNPHYFTENEQHGISMHRLLTPLESAQVIMSHVGEGVALARKAGLPEQFIDVIKEHHGTTSVAYFYNSQLESVDGDKSRVNEKDFMYAGPTPHSKESAIIMIADAFEAASRSLDGITEENLMALVDTIVNDRLKSGQFNDCLLTFEELGAVKRSLVKSLFTSAHARVSYPKKEEDNEE